jgi:hypothetical protein
MNQSVQWNDSKQAAPGARRGWPFKSVVMVTKWDKIAFVLIAVLLVLAIVFRHDLSGAFARKENPGGKEDKKGKKEKQKDAGKKQGSLSPLAPPAQPGPVAFHPSANRIPAASRQANPL